MQFSMMYFAMAKARLADAPFTNGSNVGPGFTINDAYTMDSERARYSESMDAHVQRGQRAELAGNYAELEQYDNYFMTTYMRLHGRRR